MTANLEIAAYTIGGILGIASIIGATLKLTDFLSNFFLTTKQYNSDKENEQKVKMEEQSKQDKARSQCRKDIYEAICKKADVTDVNLKFETLSNAVNSLNNQQLHILQGQAEVKAKLEMLISLYSNQQRKGENK